MRLVRMLGRPAFGSVELEGDLVLAVHLHAVDGAEIGLHVGARVVLVALEVELHGLGVERRAVVEFHALDEIEHQGLRIGELPRLGKTRLELERLRLEVDQRVEHRVEHVEVRQVAAGHRIDGGRVVGHREPQRAALARRRLRERAAPAAACAPTAAAAPLSTSRRSSIVELRPVIRFLPCIPPFIYA